MAIYVLESARSGINIKQVILHETPITIYDGDGPSVIVAHGFAGSKQIMQSYSFALAQAGYRVFSFDFYGHGRNSTPMKGDLNSVDGVTKQLIEQLNSVVDFVDADAPVALLGHSFATDIIIRAVTDIQETIGPLVVISAFSQAVTSTHPMNMLMIVGAWEPFLRKAALQALAQVSSDAGIEETAVRDGVQRKVVVVPTAEHVLVLHSQEGRRQAIAWLNEYYDRDRSPQIVATGFWTLVLFLMSILLAQPVSRILPRMVKITDYSLTWLQFATIVLMPLILVPLVTAVIKPDILSVLIADYLAVHLGIYGLIQLVLLRFYGISLGRISWLGLGAIIFWGLIVIGFLLDRYAANFLPTLERVHIILILTIGTIPFMLADSLIANGGLTHWSRRYLARIAFLGSLGLAVFLNSNGLFFLILIAPVIVIFIIFYGLIGRWVAQRQGVTSAGLGLGICLAYSLGVSFPLFAGG
ncbi:MAG: alpha/beta fold hydrolase [Aestuariivita sp.]|nr:alpha/beta fold hydrolase [Aestuariivita sp.]